MITGMHAIVFSPDAAKVREFFADVLNLPSVDAGGGWLIFALPPAELAVHPADGDGRHELYLMCDDIAATLAELRRQGHATSHRLVANLLHELKYSLQANAKTLEGARHPDRNAQFEYINTRVRQFLRRRDPVIRVGCPAFPGRQHVIGRDLAAGRGHEHPAYRLGEVERSGQHQRGVLVGRPVDAPLQVADRPGAQAGRLRQLLLGQLRLDPQLS